MKFDAKLKGALAAFLIVFIFVNLLVFLIPFPHGITFWIAYAFLMIALVFNCIVAYVSAGKAFIPKDGVRYYPLMKYGTLYLIVQGIASFIFFLADPYFTIVLIWIPLVVCLILLGIFGGLLISTYSGIRIVEHVDEKAKEDTAFIYGLTFEAAILRKQVDADMQGKLTSLYETIRYSDPVSSPSLTEIEQKIRGEMDVLKDAVTQNNSEMAEESLQKLSAMLYERNQKCKLSK